MGLLVDDLLAGPPRRGPRRSSVGQVDLAPMVAAVAARRRGRRPERPISVTTRRAGPWTATRERLSQVIVQPRRSTPGSTPRRRPPSSSCWTRSPSTAAHVGAVAVIDHGPGMTPEHDGKVFDRFYRADSSRSRKRGGSGLGLSIVAAIVEAHDGSIACKPTPGGGATFEITLPLAISRHPDAGRGGIRPARSKPRRTPTCPAPANVRKGRREQMERIGCRLPTRCEVRSLSAVGVDGRLAEHGHRLSQRHQVAAGVAPLGLGQLGSRSARRSRPRARAPGGRPARFSPSSVSSGCGAGARCRRRCSGGCRPAVRAGSTQALALVDAQGLRVHAGQLGGDRDDVDGS